MGEGGGPKSWEEGGKNAEEAKRKLLREGMLLSSVRSNYVPLFFGACFTVDFPFLVMEYAPSCSLSEVVEAAGVGVAGMRGKKSKGEMEGLFGCVEMVGGWENRWQVLVDVVVGLSVLHRFVWGGGFFFFFFFSYFSS